MNNKKKILDFIKLTAFIFCFAGIPLIILIVGYYYTWNQNKNYSIKNLSYKASAILTELSLFADQQKFWYHLFDKNINQKKQKVKTIAEAMQNHEKSLKELNKNYDFEYIIYNPKFGLIASLSADCLGGNDKERIIAFKQIWNSKFLHQDYYNPPVEKILNKVFGPQFYIGHLYIKDIFLCWTDSLYKRRLIWNSFQSQCLIMTFLKPESLTDLTNIQTYFENLSKEGSDSFKLSLKDSNTNTFLHPNIEESKKQEIQTASLIYENNRLTEIETEHFFVYPKYLRSGICVFIYFDKEKYISKENTIYWKIEFLFFLFLCICISIYGWRVIWLHKLDNISIKWKLGFLFFFANGLPLLVLIYIGNDFLRNARNDYIQKITKEGTAFLQDYDEKYELSFAKCLIKQEKIKKEFIKTKNKNTFNKYDLEKLYHGVSSDTLALFVISSEGHILARNGDGIFDDNSIKKNNKGQYYGSLKLDPDSANRFNKYFSNQIIYSQKIGTFILTLLNNKPVNEKYAAEIELLLETTIRQKLDKFISQIFEQLGKFAPFGFSNNVYPAVIDTITFSENNSYDYFIIQAIKVDDFQYHYLNSSILQANRNELKLKVIVIDKENYFYPSKERSKTLDDFRKKLSIYPIKEPIVLNHNGTDYIAMGFESIHFEKCGLIGLYPLFLIDEHVKARRNEFIIISLASLLVTFILSTIIIRSFLFPLSEINTGAIAIKNKDFQYRLPQLGRDEFGAIGNIFNKVVIDLEELSVAGAIQEQLLPNTTIKTGNFSLFGKSVYMSELGGDYFDFIEMEDNKFSVAIGDVAGHGVGASLIMAMAKAGLVSLDYLWKEPQKIISRLHDLIMKSKTQNQKKIMTFQYMYLDGNSGNAVFSNAGGCSPIIIRKQKGLIEELTLKGAVLGAFKKAKFLETNLVFEPGDAIVFYTDGIVESKNSKGEMLGYGNLKNLVQNSWNENAEIFYKNIYNKYLEYIGRDESKADDDVTIVVLVFNTKNEIEEKTEL